MTCPLVRSNMWIILIATYIQSILADALERFFNQVIHILAAHTFFHQRDPCLDGCPCDDMGSRGVEPGIRKFREKVRQENGSKLIIFDSVRYASEVLSD